MDVQDIFVLIFLVMICGSIIYFDIRYFIIPDKLNLLLATAGFILLIDEPVFLLLHCLTGLMGYLFVTSINLVYNKMRGRDGIGGGDAKFVAASGIWLGPVGLPLSVLLACFGALTFAAFFALLQRKVNALLKIPFGAFLAPAFFCVWFFPDLRLGIL